MTSVLRSHLQIPSRIRYFVAILDYSGGTGVIPNFDFDTTISLPTYPGPVLTLDAFTAAYPGTYNYPALTTGDLLKDLGQQFTLTDANNNHRAIYRRVQRVQGVDSEGVGGSSADSWGSFYVKVWDADASLSEPVAVARTG